MTYAICFDFPELMGEPHFAGWFKDTPGFAPTLETAMTFEEEESAEQFLKNTYGTEVASFGTVVELGE